MITLISALNFWQQVLLDVVQKFATDALIIESTKID
jgi:hypothetical protein